jgi:hypothetical protein
MSCGSGEPQLASSGRTTRRHSFSGPVASGEVTGAMATVNYWQSSFHPGGRSFSRGPVGYKRFKPAAEAIRFAMEELPSELLFAYLEVEEDRFDGSAIRQLYESEAYPLRRHRKSTGSA